jgi:hypothetical protein
MRKVLASTLAGLTAAGALAVTAAPAEARPHHYRHHHHGGGGDAAAAAVVAGIAGLAIGSALSSGDHNRSYYRDSYYGPGYYEPYRYRYRTCISRERVWDPYIGRHVTVERRYAC